MKYAFLDNMYVILPVVAFGMILVVGFGIAALSEKDVFYGITILIAIISMFVSVVVLMNMKSEVNSTNNEIITDTVTSKYGEFALKDEKVTTIFPNRKYDIELKSHPKELCELNTADKPDNISVECGKIVPVLQRQ